MQPERTVLFVSSDNDLFLTPPGYVAAFAARGIRLVATPPSTPVVEAAGLAPEAEGLLMCSGRYPVGDALLDLLPRCRIVVRMGAGYDNVDVPVATRRGIVVSNMPGNIPEEVSDHTIALFLACLRRLGVQDRALRSGVWDPTLAAPARRLRGQTAGFVGFGRIARLVAEKMIGFRLRYLAYDPYIPPDAGADLGVTLVGFEELLRESDLVTLHVPATPETRNLFDRRAFALMKRDAILVNTARGFLIDEQALVEALGEGRLRAAGLDVFQAEPSPPTNPLFQAPTLLATPHVAGYSIEGLEDFYGFGYQLITEFLMNGTPPRWTLNPETLAGGRGRVSQEALP